MGGGDGHVIFLDASAHLVEEVGLKADSSGKCNVRVSVFSVEMGADVRVERVGLAHDLLPIGVFEPCVGILRDFSVVCDGEGDNFRGRGNGSRQGVAG